VKAASLVVILIVAKVLAVWGRDLPLSIWLPSMLFWDDVAVGLGFWTAERLLRRRGVIAALYWLIVAWAALNVPVARALASPLTTNMLEAAAGALSDSIAHYVTATNVARIGLLIGLAAVLPPWLGRMPPRPGMGAVLAGIILAAPGPLLAHRFDLRGFDRNAITAIVRTSFPRVEGRALDADWRSSPFPDGRGQDLSRWRATAETRNVVMIVLESTAASYLKAYGAKDDPTPHSTALAANAIRFDRAYSVYPESVKGLFAVLCSRAPAFDVSAEMHAGAACAPLARSLSAAGYRTGLFHSGRFGYLGMDAVVARQGFDTLEDAGTIGGQRESSFGVDEVSTVSRVLSWIDRAPQEQPFFVAYLPTAGHHPYATDEPGPFSGRGEFSAYQNALYEGDRSLGALLEGLRARGLDRHTLFVVFGDHGEAFGQHDGNFGHTLQIYDENIRVPLFFAAPGVTTGHVAVDNVASVLDIAPTILDLVGLPVPASYEGRSLLQSGPRMALFYSDYSVGLLGLQDGCLKYQLDIDASRSRLFDTCADPGETRDIAAIHSDRIRPYSERLRNWSSATRASITSQR